MQGESGNARGSRGGRQGDDLIILGTERQERKDLSSNRPGDAYSVFPRETGHDMLRENPVADSSGLYEKPDHACSMRKKTEQFKNE